MDGRVDVPGVAADVHVVAKPRRRSYTAEDKRRILQEADACTTPGTVEALLRREGCTPRIWSSGAGRERTASWRPWPRRSGGRKPTPVDPRDRKIAELERQLAQMTDRAERAETLVDAQKQLAALLGRPRAIAQS